jgi:hypothetical protein
MSGRQGTSGQAGAPTADPQDVEALEGVIAALGADVSDEIVAHERIMHSLVDSSTSPTAPPWLPDHHAPTRPTCSRSTPPSRRRGRASSAAGSPSSPAR